MEDTSSDSQYCTNHTMIPSNAVLHILNPFTIPDFYANLNATPNPNV